MARHATPTHGARPAEISAPGFVGRRRELAALERAVTKPESMVLVNGEAGIGKSRLVHEFVASPVCRARRIITAVCPPFRAPFTLAPVVDALRQACDSVGTLGLSPLAGVLRPLFPEWAYELPPPPEPAEDPTASRHRLFRALRELLDLLQVSVLVVEDAHWADEATLEFLLFLTSRQPVPLRLVVTCRPEEVSDGSLLLRLSSRVGGEGTRLALGALDLGETARLVSSMLSDEPVSQKFATFLHRHTAGIPLAVEESVRLMHDRADILWWDGEWVRRDLTAITVPPTIRDAVLERTGRLSRRARTVLQAAAVVGDPADEPMLTRVVAATVEEVRAGLAEALTAGLLHEDSCHLVAFRHALAERSLYDAVPAPIRREMHRRAGDFLADAAPLPVAQVARHFRAAGDLAAWAEYAEQAADAALAAGDEATASVLLQDLLTDHRQASAASLVRLVDKLPLTSITDHSRLRAVTDRLGCTLDGGGLTSGDEALIRAQRGRLLLAVGQYDTGRAELERALPGLSDDVVAATSCAILLGWPQGTPHPSSVHRSWLRRADVTGRRLPPLDRLRLLIDRTTALLMMGEEEGWAEVERIPEAATTPVERPQIGRGLLNIGDAAMLWGRYAEAGRRLDRALELAERHQQVRLRYAANVTCAHLDWYTGRWTGLLQRATDLADEEYAQPVDQLEAVLVHGLLSSTVDTHGKSGDILRHVIAEARRHGAVKYTMEPTAVLARSLLAGGDAEEALRLTDEPADIVVGRGFWVWGTELLPARVRALVSAGHGGETAELIAAFARGLRGRNAPGPRAALVECRAVAAQGCGDLSRAAELFGRAAKAWQALPRPYEAAFAKEWQAHSLLAAGDAAGLPLLSAAFDAFSALGARNDADRVVGALREHGARPRRAGRPSYGDRLSPREMEVITLLRKGLTNRQIAQELVLSTQTVASHLRSAMRKLRVASRTALAVRTEGAGGGGARQARVDTEDGGSN